MSNSSLVARLEQSITDFRAGRLGLADLACQIDFQAGSFEGLAFPAYQRLRSLSHSLHILAGYAEEGCPDEAEVERLLADLQAVLGAVPQM